MNDTEHKLALEKAIKTIFEGINQLKGLFGNSARKFTIDGRLVGDIGEVIAARYFDITLDKKSEKDYDAGFTSDPTKRVQIKATFKDSLTFKNKDGYLIGLKLFENGEHEVIYNGLSHRIYDYFSHRKGMGETLLSFPNSTLKVLNLENSEQDRVPIKKINT